MSGDSGTGSIEKPSGARKGEGAAIGIDGDNRNARCSGGACIGVVLKRGEGVLSKLLMIL